MVEVSVRIKKFDRLKGVIPDKFHQAVMLAVGVAPRIHYHALQSVIPKDIAASAEVIEIKSLNHSGKITKRVGIFATANQFIRHLLLSVMHIAVAGNIGSGKTTLTKLLSNHYGWEPKYESVDFNPYLADFYNDMQRWSFNVQVYFLNKRFEDVVSIRKSQDTIIQDRTIYEDARIFAPNLHDMGLMDSRDFENYSSLFSLMMSLVKSPDLIIYLKSSIPNLVAQIQKRGREYESSIRIDYLKGLNVRYEKWIEEYKDGPKLILNVDELKFEENPDHFNQIIDKIDAQLYGLF